MQHYLSDEVIEPGSTAEEGEDPSYAAADFAGTSLDGEAEVRDLGFIVEDRDDRRVDTAHQILADSVNLHPRSPGSDVSSEVSLLEGEDEEDDFRRTSMLPTDDDDETAANAYLEETLHYEDGREAATDIGGEVAGVIPGTGTSLPQDAGSHGMRVGVSPIVEPDENISRTPDESG